MKTTASPSPASPFIFVPNAINNMDLALKTQPFYSIFYHTYSTPGSKQISNKVRGSAAKLKNITSSGTPCKDVLLSQDPNYTIYNQIPFTNDNVNGKANRGFVMIIFLTTFVVGTTTFLYWSHFLSNELMEDKYQKIIKTRAVYLSVFFTILTIILSLLFYEFFTLKFLSLKWFNKYIIDTEQSNIHNFIFNTRKMLIWGLITIWLAIVMFITIVISKRPKMFKNQVAINITSIIMLFCAQYLYYKTPNRMMKTFCLFLTVFIIGLVMGLLYFA